MLGNVLGKRLLCLTVTGAQPPLTQMKGEASRAGAVEHGPRRAAEVGVGVVEGDRLDLAVHGVADNSVLRLWM